MNSFRATAHSCSRCINPAHSCYRAAKNRVTAESFWLPRQSAEDLQLALAQDPFSIHGVASYQVIQFVPTMAAPALQSLVAA